MRGKRGRGRKWESEGEGQEGDRWFLVTSVVAKTSKWGQVEAFFLPLKSFCCFFKFVCFFIVDDDLGGDEDFSFLAWKPFYLMSLRCSSPSHQLHVASSSSATSTPPPPLFKANCLSLQYIIIWKVDVSLPFSPPLSHSLSHPLLLSLSLYLTRLLPFPLSFMHPFDNFDFWFTGNWLFWSQLQN